VVGAGPRRSADGDLLAQAGYVQELASGLYTLLPLGQRVFARISALVRGALAAQGAQEVTMPLLQPEALWLRTVGGQTRAEVFGGQLFRLVGSSGERWVLAPTHEEVATAVAAAQLERSGLPAVIYQVAPRFRDQRCAAGDGLLRAREFVMADAYSFAADRDGLDESYRQLRGALEAVVGVAGLRARWVRADGGAMLAAASEELVAELPGEHAAVAVTCAGCGEAASVEVAEGRPGTSAGADAGAGVRAGLEEIERPGRELDEVAAELGVPIERCLSVVPFLSADRCVLAVLPRDRVLNPIKLSAALQRAGVESRGLMRANARELAARGGSYAWLSLVHTPSEVLVVADRSLQHGAGLLFSALEVDRFYVDLRAGRDFRVDLFADLEWVDGGPCARCGGPLQTLRGIEIGHVFKLGTAFSTAFGAELDGLPLEMGCYGLGVTRLMAALALQHADARGLVWPAAVAPFVASVSVSATAAGDAAAEALARELARADIEVLLDDSGGDQALRLGIPYQLRGASSGDSVEIRERASGAVHALAARDVANWLHARGDRREPGGASGVGAP
jgi:prolyl-tRNA synthetase